jgi:predicted nucleotidyltransferase
MGSIAIRPGMAIEESSLQAFCRQYHVAWLALFGSVLRDDFAPSSDVDVLVEFEPGATPGYFTIYAMEQELSRLLSGRSIDLGTKVALNRWLRDRVLSEARVLYDAA